MDNLYITIAGEIYLVTGLEKVSVMSLAHPEDKPKRGRPAKKKRGRPVGSKNKK